MREVDPVAKGRPGGSELGTRVHSFRLGRVGGDVRHDADSATDKVADGIGQVELALGVVRLEPVERGPEHVGPEDVDRGVALAEL